MGRVLRRDVLKGMIASLGLAGALVFPAWPKVANPTMGLAEIRRHIRHALAAIVDEELTPKAIGRKYLTLHPEEADIDRLWTALNGLSAPLRSDELRTRLAKLGQQDFEDGEIAIVDGWILARTEARACALLTLV
jgi:hypothetical protein